ncbi:TetR/AcrR family transcriptional regulator [Cognatishimia activa]|uniref:Transcriptional regulator BetI n=1 Tax=Cognatishimia activa TaxID=1715691 RepID=A0A0P1IS21_9RHOB|nr:TetR/AcrR family transcriptional regulator [Cognatishimia activa]CUI62022.1 transcriptional regulator BetI [Cognatishimia activa]CUK26318.1 transcriptional regulator BetI [Cognatishimia activa]
MRNAEIAMAALATVGKYGLQKTTMSDIAQAAGISRQSLYNVYPNKEELLRAAVKYFMDADLQMVKEAWKDLDGAEAKLDAYFSMGPLRWYDQLTDMPNVNELLEGMSAIVEPSLKDGHLNWIELLADLLGEKIDADQAHEVADLVFFSAKNAKFSAASRAQLERRLDLLKEMVLTTYFR